MHVKRENLPQVRAMGLFCFVLFACVEYMALSMEYVALLMERMAVAGEGDGSGFVCLYVWNVGLFQWNIGLFYLNLGLLSLNIGLYQ